jgi:putative ABC transport system substrate-binding protein
MHNTALTQRSGKVWSLAYGEPMNRRTLITLVGSAAAAWPFAARAQQVERVRRIGVLSGFTENDQVARASIAALREGLALLGWVEDRTLRIDLRFGSDDPDRIRAYAAELVSLALEVIVTDTGATTRAVQQQTQSIPIVITGAGDPIGLVKSIAHPEGNITGITDLYGSLGGKWMQLLKEAAPRIETVGLIRNPQLDPAGAYILAIVEAMRALAVKAVNMPYRDAVDIVHAIDALGSEPNCGLIVLGAPPSAANRQTIIRLAEQHRLPTIYPNRAFVAEGGLMGYGSVQGDRFRRAATYVDRLLRGAKVSELPVQFPTKFELVINLKTAKAIGLEVPPTLIARADEVIE